MQGDRIDRFIDGLEAETAPEIDRRALGEALDAALARAREAWPGVDIEDGDFTDYLGTQLRGASIDQLSRLETSDLYLACGCLRGSPAAIAAFDAILPREVALATSRMRLDAAEIDDLVQRMRVRLLVAEGDSPPKIAGFAGRAPLTRWLRVSARREALSVLRVQQRIKTRDDELVRATSSDSPDAELAYLQQRYGNECNQAFREAFGTLTTHQRTVLKLHFVDGFTLDELAKMYGEHRSSLWRAIRKSREAVIEATREGLRQRLHLASTEIDSLLRLVQGDIDLSISSCLRSA